MADLRRVVKLHLRCVTVIYQPFFIMNLLGLRGCKLTGQDGSSGMHLPPQSQFSVLSIQILQIFFKVKCKFIFV